jgi:hypothetical protein
VEVQLCEEALLPSHSQIRLWPPTSRLWARSTRRESRQSSRRRPSTPRTSDPPLGDVTNLVSESSKLVLEVRKLVRREVSESRPSGAVQTSAQPKSVAVTPRTHQLRKRLRELIGTRLQPLGLLSPLALHALDRGQLLTMTESRSLLCGLDCQRHLTAPLLPFLPLALRRHDSVYHAEVPGSLESSMSTACTTDDTRVSQPPVVSPERGPDTVTS